MEPYLDIYVKLWSLKISNRSTCDDAIAEILDIDYEIYTEILKTHGAHRQTIGSEYWFDTQEEVEAVIKTLEPHYILAKLMKGTAL